MLPVYASVHVSVCLYMCMHMCGCLSWSNVLYCVCLSVCSYNFSAYLLCIICAYSVSVSLLCCISAYVYLHLFSVPLCTHVPTDHCMCACVCCLICYCFYLCVCVWWPSLPLLYMPATIIGYCTVFFLRLSFPHSLLSFPQNGHAFLAV